jgi:muramoyltetrapeptide carboxypeptidase
MFRDPRVRAILALRGGYGSLRLLSHIDYRLIARCPKILAGFSDLTALQLALWNACRLVTFHGPMLGSDFAGRVDPFTEERFWTMVTSPVVPQRLAPPRGVHTRALAGGRSNGRLMGGNLSLLISLLGTPYQPSFAGCILFFEEIGEEPYRVDRMLTHLHLTGILKDVRGIVSGQFTGCVPQDRTRPSLTLRTILEETAERTDVPFLSGVPFGHVRHKLTLPIGIRAALDAERGTLDLLEAAVS